jgi:multiple sugar transport system substrate-binding protein
VHDHLESQPVDALATTFTGATAAVLCGLLLSGCGDGGRGDPLVFAVGGAPAELAVWEQFVAEFQDRTGIEVEIARQPANTGQRRQELIVALDSGQRNPDVFLMDVAWVGLFAAAGWLEPLTGVDRTPFFPGILDTVDVRDGELLALPVYVDGGVLYYRRDLLEEYGIAAPPETLDQLRRTARRVEDRQRPRRPDFYGFVWQGAQYEGLVCVFLELAGAEGGFTRRDGRLLVDTEANVRALRAMREMIADGISPPSTFTEMREEQARTWFQQGNALYERNWPYAWALHQGSDSPVRGLVGVTAVPALNADDRVSTLGGWHAAVSIHSDRKADARRLVEFITSYEIQKRMVTTLGWNPGRRDLYDDPDVLALAPQLAELAPIFRHARPRPVEPYYPQLSRILQRRLNAALAGSIAPENALAAAQREIDALLARYAPPDAAPAPRPGRRPTGGAAQ